ncbi:MAG TPA: hypothetical protein VIL20_24560 [Sandaracinaceae bacterium]
MRSPLSLVLGAVALVALALANDALRARSHASFASGQRYEDIYYLPPPGALRYLSLGWDEALADLIWLRALVYFGDELVHQGQVRHVFDYTEAMLALDPRFAAVYRWVGMAALYRPVAVPVEDMERAIAIMERGARLFPNDGRLAWDLGATLVFELAPHLEDPEEKDRVRERGLPHLQRAVRLGAAPPWAALTNASLLSHLGRTEQAARHLEEMYLAIDDEQTRARIAERIRTLRARAEAEAFVAAMRELEERHRESFPYVSPSLFLLLGDRPPVDLVAPVRDGLPRSLARDGGGLEGAP